MTEPDTRGHKREPKREHKEAMLYTRLPDDYVQCALCAHRCKIAPGRTGLCHVRRNEGGKLVSLVYGRLVSAALDPIEKKPLFHFLPGTTTFSIATAGCNFRCSFCQNYGISQALRERPEADIPGESAKAEAVVRAALDSGARTVSYTYTEPTIAMEFFFETATLARASGLRNAFVSNGFMTPESARLMATVLDADNIDLKGDDEFYKKHCGGRLGPVLDTISLMKSLGVWVEVTTLLIPGLNDGEPTLKEMARFLASVDPGMPWHVSRFHPMYQMTDRPSTPMDSLQRAMLIGRDAGLKYVYGGNVQADGLENTSCKLCGEVLVRRRGFTVISNRISKGACPDCGALQDGIWE